MRKKIWGNAMRFKAAGRSAAMRFGAAALAAMMLCAAPVVSTADELSGDVIYEGDVPGDVIEGDVTYEGNVSGDVTYEGDASGDVTYGDEASDFAASWDDILYEEPVYDDPAEWDEEYAASQDAATVTDGTQEQSAAGTDSADAQQLPADGADVEQLPADGAGTVAGTMDGNGEVVQDGLSAQDILPDGMNAGGGADTSGVLDGMEPGPTALDLEEQARERALAYLETPYAVLEKADPKRIEKTLEELSAVPSPTGSDGELEIGQYIMDTMQAMGYHVTSQNFHEDFLNEDLVDVPGMNILAEKEVNDPYPTDEVLLVLTHYDSRTNPEEGDPLANDKTGAAAVLEAARLVAEQTTVTDICFVFLSGEEDGYYGSTNFIESIQPFLEKIVGVICVGPNGYSQKLTLPVDEDREEVIETFYNTVLASADGKENRPVDMLLTSAAVQKITLTGASAAGEAIPGVLEDGILAGTLEDGILAGNVADGMDPASDGNAVPDSNAQAAGGNTAADGDAQADGADGDGQAANAEEEARAKAISSGSLDWKLMKDTGSSCIVFAQNGMETAYVHQQFSGASQAGQADENVTVEVNSWSIAHTADILARTVGMYMAGIR